MDEDVERAFYRLAIQARLLGKTLEGRGHSPLLQAGPGIEIPLACLARLAGPDDFLVAPEPLRELLETLRAGERPEDSAPVSVVRRVFSPPREDGGMAADFAFGVAFSLKSRSPTSCCLCLTINSSSDSEEREDVIPARFQGLPLLLLRFSPAAPATLDFFFPQKNGSSADPGDFTQRAERALARVRSSARALALDFQARFPDDPLRLWRDSLLARGAATPKLLRKEQRQAIQTAALAIALRKGGRRSEGAGKPPPEPGRRRASLPEKNSPSGTSEPGGPAGGFPRIRPENKTLREMKFRATFPRQN